jgi:hypothetical protein
VAKSLIKSKLVESTANEASRLTAITSRSPLFSITHWTTDMTRGNQREIDRQRAANRHAAKGGGAEGDPKKRAEEQAKALQEKVRENNSGAINPIYDDKKRRVQ